MKRFLCMILSACLLLCLFGCSLSPASEQATPSTQQTAPSETTAPPATQPTSQPDASAVYEAPMAAVSLPLIVENHQSESGDEIAYYTHQDISITLPDADVAQAVTLDLLNRIDKTRASADAVFDSADADFSGQDSWYPYSYAITYQPMRLDENVLSLFGTETAFDGSPRSVHNTISVTYDLTTGEPLTLKTILHEENYADAMCELILEGLKSSADILFADYESTVKGKFSTNVPVSSWYFSNEGLCFYFAPYEIAPYSAGTIVSQIPYDRLSGLMKDAYFPGEQLMYSGAVLAEKLDAIPEAYTQFAEATLAGGGEKLLITTDGSISNVRLTLSAIAPETGVNEAVVLALAGMGPTDAILLNLDLDNALNNLTITFDSYGQTQTLQLKESENHTLIFSK